MKKIYYSILLTSIISLISLNSIAGDKTQVTGLDDDQAFEKTLKNLSVGSEGNEHVPMHNFLNTKKRKGNMTAARQITNNESEAKKISEMFNRNGYDLGAQKTKHFFVSIEGVKGDDVQVAYNIHYANPENALLKSKLKEDKKGKK